MAIMLVSHNLAAIRSSCTRAVFIAKGQLLADGSPDTVIDHYTGLIAAERTTNDRGPGVLDQEARDVVSLLSCEFFDEMNHVVDTVAFDQSFRARITMRADIPLHDPMIVIGLVRWDGVNVCNFSNWYDNVRLGTVEGLYQLDAQLPGLRIVPGHYSVHVLVWNWGGGHTDGDTTLSQPLSWARFGSLKFEGGILNEHDGVFQVPALSWRLQDHEDSASAPDFVAGSTLADFERN
jgi:hypothetical protein